ncbi:conserved hypothetical protein [Ricinus communis]|uniref:FRIGIDA-like protein n=1 Tax=Ricinus communis TaxID=3988 RepID=B9SL00_RICCO|nr:conserved hypothetical protein [Ricinus communis]
MDVSGLLKFYNFKKERICISGDLTVIMEVVDPAILILDGVDEFMNSKIEKVGVIDKMWAYGMLLEVLFPEISSCYFGRKPKGMKFSRSVVEEKVGKILDRWKKWKGMEEKMQHI